MTFNFNQINKRKALTMLLVLALLGTTGFLVLRNVFRADTLSAISGNIYDSVQKGPLADVSITVSSTDSSSITNPVTTKTDASGHYALSVPDLSFTQISIQKDGFWDMEGSIVNVGGLSSITANMALKPGFGKEDVQLTAFKKLSTGSSAQFGLSINPTDDKSAAREIVPSGASYKEQSAGSGSGYDLNLNQEINPDSNNFQFTTGGKLPEELTNSAAVYFPEMDKYYIFGGKKSDGSLSNAVYEYDRNSPNDAAIVASLPYGNANGSAIYIPSKKQIYYFATGRPNVSQSEIFSFGLESNSKSQSPFKLTSIGSFPDSTKVNAILVKDKIFLAIAQDDKPTSTYIISSTIDGISNGVEFGTAKPWVINAVNITPYYSTYQDKIYLFGGNSVSIYEINPNIVPDPNTDFTPATLNNNKLGDAVSSPKIHKVGDKTYLYDGLVTDKMIVIDDTKTKISFSGSKNIAIPANIQSYPSAEDYSNRSIIFTPTTQTLAPVFTYRAGQAYTIQSTRDMTIVFRGRAKKDAFSFTNKDIQESNYRNYGPTRFANPYAADITSGDIIFNYQDKDYNLKEAMDQNVIRNVAWNANYPGQIQLDPNNLDQTIKPGDFLAFWTKKSGVKVRVKIPTIIEVTNSHVIDVPSVMSEKDILWASNSNSNNLSEEDDFVRNATMYIMQSLVADKVSQLGNEDIEGDLSNENQNVGQIEMAVNGKIINANNTIPSAIPNTYWTDQLKNVYENASQGIIEAKTNSTSKNFEECFTQSGEYETCTKNYNIDLIKLIGRIDSTFWQIIIQLKLGDKITVYNTVPWSESDANWYVNIFTQLYPVIKKYYGPPQLNNGLHYEQALLYSFPVGSSQYMRSKRILAFHVPVLNLMMLNYDTLKSDKTKDPNNWGKIWAMTVVHETSHSFHDDNSISDYKGSSLEAHRSWEEGQAEYLTYLVSKDRPDIASDPIRYFGALEYYSENNKSNLCVNGAKEEGAWFAKGSLQNRYAMAMGAWDAIISEHPNFLKELSNSLKTNQNLTPMTRVRTLVNNHVGLQTFDDWYKSQCGLDQFDYAGGLSGWLIDARAKMWSKVNNNYKIAETFYPFVENKYGKIITMPDRFSYKSMLWKTSSAPQKETKKITTNKNEVLYPDGCKNDCPAAKVEFDQVEPQHKYTITNRISSIWFGLSASINKDRYSNVYTAAPGEDAGIYGVVAEAYNTKVQITPLNPNQLPTKEIDVNNGYFETSKSGNPNYGWNAGTYHVKYYTNCGGQRNYTFTKSEGRYFLAIRTGKSTTDSTSYEPNTFLSKIASALRLNKSNNVVKADENTCYQEDLQINDIKTETLPDGTEKLTFTTTRPALVNIDWGETKDYGLSADDQPNDEMISHVVIFAPVVKNKIYYYKISAQDAAGETDTGGEFDSVKAIEKEGDFTVSDQCTPSISKFEMNPDQKRSSIINNSWDQVIYAYHAPEVLVDWSADCPISDGSITYGFRDHDWSSGSALGMVNTKTVPLSANSAGGTVNLPDIVAGVYQSIRSPYDYNAVLTLTMNGNTYTQTIDFETDFMKNNGDYVRITSITPEPGSNDIPNPYDLTMTTDTLIFKKHALIGYWEDSHAYTFGTTLTYHIFNSPIGSYQPPAAGFTTFQLYNDTWSNAVATGDKQLVNKGIYNCNLNSDAPSCKYCYDNNSSECYDNFNAYVCYTPAEPSQNTKNPVTNAANTIQTRATINTADSILTVLSSPSYEKQADGTNVLNKIEVQYGTQKDNYPNTITTISGSNGSNTAKLPKLKAHTYHYKTIVTTKSGKKVISEDQTFKYGNKYLIFVNDLFGNAWYKIRNIFKK